VGIPADLLKNSTRFPSPPGIVLRLLESIRKDDFSFAEIAGIIKSDPALTTRVLTMVNSSFYSLPAKVSNIERALAIMGVNAVKNIALSFMLVSTLKSDNEGSFDFSYFWRRAITAAVSAELLASHFNVRDDDTFVIALLQDIGVFVLYSCSPEDYSRLLEDKKARNLRLEVLEEMALGFNHQEVGSELLRTWGLPENIFVPIRYHHMHGEAPVQYRSLARILFLSDMVSSLYNERQCSDKVRHIAEAVKDGMGIRDSELEAFIDEIREKTVELCSYFDITPDDMKPFSQMLQEANEELSKMNLEYETMVVRLREEKLKADRLAHELEKSNRKLSEISFEDSLTGLYNRRYLFDIVDKEMARAERSGRYFSIALFDIDFFKKINDSDGHHAGDIVLKRVGEVLNRTKRKTDIAVRYGGDEFVVVLPETDQEQSLIFAERLRVAIEGADTAVAGHTIRITISIGVTTYIPGRTGPSIQRLMEVADKALYDAKRSGRNRVNFINPFALAKLPGGAGDSSDAQLINAVELEMGESAKVLEVDDLANTQSYSPNMEMGETSCPR
jgi:diguanylate cyclase (GGDEF)-like protein